MKKTILLLIVLIFVSCSTGGCFDSTGKIIQKEINLEPFDKILVGNEVSLIIKQSDIQKVIIETGENLMSDVSAEVIDGQLVVNDDNSCNLIREYAVTKVYVFSPNIKVIRTDTARDIISDGIITYDSLTLISENHHQDTLTIGDFKLHVENQNLSITSNGISNFTIIGTTTNLKVNFYSGNSRFIGNTLQATHINLTHYSTNDILINPINSLHAKLYSIGDVISYNYPDQIEIEENYSGKVIFR